MLALHCRLVIGACSHPAKSAIERETGIFDQTGTERHARENALIEPAPAPARTSQTDLLAIEDLRVAFMLQTGAVKHWNEVVKGVSLRLQRGKTLALVGESGSGKSVISQAVMGILPRNGKISGGRILFADDKGEGRPGKVIDLATLDRDDPSFRALRGDRIGMIFQEPMSSLSPVHTIGNQIAESVRLHRPDFRGKERAKTENMLGLVGFRNPHNAFDQYSFELSGGLRQRAMLAMALICNPALLIADEPTTALDVTVQAQILKLMQDLQREIGMSMLLITHDLGVVANVADDVAVIYHGEIMESGTVEDIFRSPTHPYVKALLKATPHFDMADGERLVSLREVKRSLGTMAGAQAASKPSGAGAAPLIEVRNLKKTYGQVKSGWFGAASKGGFVAVDDVSFEINRGECLGLVGESGCGKTSVSKIIMRAITPDSGSVSFNDGAGKTEVLGLDGTDLRHFRQRVQMIFQDPVSSLSPRMTVANILREPLDIQNIGDPAKRLDRVRDLLSAVGLDPRFLNRYPHSFSGGQRQRIGIARALALQPDLIVCDEAVSALDVSVQAQVLNLLKDLQADLGLTYLFISHNLAVVGYIADRIAVMARGKIVEIAPRHILFRQPVHPYTKILLKSVPFTDLDRPLDLEATARTSPSDPQYWADAFKPDNTGRGLEMVEIAPGHKVLARSAAECRELVA